MTDIQYTADTKSMIDGLKSVCANYGLGNDGNEFKIITQVFLYKFINDKYTEEAKQQEVKLAKANNFQEAFEALSDDELNFLNYGMSPDVPKLKPHQTISYLYNSQNKDDFSKLFDDTLHEISVDNSDIFSVKSFTGVKDTLFDRLSQFISDPSQRDAFCRAIINKVAGFSFARMFSEKFDFFATIFEYLIKDYNSDSGGKYAEYYTPRAVARIIASILVNEKVKSAKCYDPSVGSGSLMMALAHEIGEKKCSIYSEDISQKSALMMRLNLILNHFSQSIPNVIKTNSILQPAYIDEKFDFIVSNPPFKLDFSDFRDDLTKDAFKERFFAGVPKIPANKKESMAIYLLFIQHIMFSLGKTGRAAVVVPTGFITAQSGIEKKIREQLIERGWLRGVVSMPSQIFANTGTNVSVLFMDRRADNKKIVLIDASKLGETVKEGKNQRTVLRRNEEQRIVKAMHEKKPEEEFSVVVTADEIRAKNYSFSAGQYFEIKIEYVDITPEEFAEKMNEFKTNLKRLFSESNNFEKEILKNLESLEL